MTRFRSLIASAAVAGVLVTGGAFAQGPRGGGPGGRGFGGPFGVSLPLRELALTDAQRQQVRAIVERHRENAQSQTERLRTALDAQRKAIETMPVDEALIRSTTQDVAEAQTEAAIQQAHLRSEVWNVLTPEQRDQAKKLQAEREARRQQQGQRRQNRG